MLYDPNEKYDVKEDLSTLPAFTNKIYLTEGVDIYVTQHFLQ